MQKASTCPECDGSNVYESVGVSAGGGYAPNYLPGLGAFMVSGRFKVRLCRDCGFTRFFADKEALDKLPQSNKWHRV